MARYKIFTDDWFERHQKKFFWLLNTPIIKWLTRRLFKIHNSVPYKSTVNGVYSNRIHFDCREEGGKVFMNTQFYCNKRYSKIVCKLLYPLWSLMHFWDWLVADRFKWANGLSFGFTDFSPDADPETSTMDGFAIRHSVNETFPTIRSGAGTASFDSFGTLRCNVQTSGTLNQFQRIDRVIMLFDTSSIGADEISLATIRLYYSAKANPSDVAPELDIVSSSPASNTAIANADYGALGSTVFGSIAYADFTSAQYNDISLDSNGIDNINKSGVSKFGARLNWDTDGTYAPTFASNHDNYMHFDEADGTNAPILQVTHAAASTGTARRLVMGAGYSGVFHY